jgi:integration host factor subunit beta
MATITKKDLIDRIASSAGCKRVDVKKVVQNFLDEMIAELGKGNRLEFRDFGVFEIKARAPRVAQNPKTLQRVNVPAKRTVKFKVGRLLKEQLDVEGTEGSPPAGKPEIVVRSSELTDQGRAAGSKKNER